MVVIEQMDLPKTCWDCIFSQRDPYWCDMVAFLVKQGKLPEYVEDEHGIAHHNGHLSKRATKHGTVRPSFCVLTGEPVTEDPPTSQSEDTEDIPFC